MSRPLAPFVRHLGEAKHRVRQLQACTQRVADAAVGVAGLTLGDAALARAIADARDQLRLLETLSARWPEERSLAATSRSTAVRDDIRALLGRPPTE